MYIYVRISYFQMAKSNIYYSYKQLLVIINENTVETGFLVTIFAAQCSKNKPKYSTNRIILTIGYY